MIKYLVLFLALISNAVAFEYIDSEIKCMADNIYFEARNETVKGQVAVALVTMNRVDSKHYPDSICDVVWEHKQFSWTIDGKSDKPKNKKAYRRSELVATIVMNSRYVNDDFNDFTQGATHYHTVSIKPYWSYKMKYIAVIDSHIFYKFKK